MKSLINTNSEKTIDLDREIDLERYVFLDLETTGFSCERDEIIEFGALTFEDNHFIEHNILIKPKSPIPLMISKINNIDDETVKNAKSIEEEFERIVKIISNKVIVAHNKDFDLRFLNANAKRLGYSEFDNLSYCTLKRAKKKLPRLKCHKLDFLAKHFKIPFDETQSHRATYDAWVLKELFLKMVF
ncbi:DNA polymerase III subunit alpha [Spiroplasma sabaudiense Ar-1343]|uniref:DNA polymerase III subunit alpha n=1 Tax=Spiroplasma sabaudiense Ar-1343 TaxID=1276257 RepID=W6AA21_9MOLU|nr:3'-5' exonuclease [Spiroplasma sabaudiense]AHI53841.1 DNA polymerase III subunit alpha [Spiroplasma sabaudiense Ar-1343]